MTDAGHPHPGPWQPSPPRRGASRAPATLWGIAALVLVAVGVFVATQRAKSESLDQQLIARLQTIDTQPLSADELTVGAAPVEHNGLRLLTPRGMLLERRPTLRWVHPTGGGTATVIVEDEQTGDAIVRGESESGVFAWPIDEAELSAGQRYHWSCEVAGPMGPLRGRALFETVSAVPRWAFEAQVAMLGSGTAADLASVHLALRHDFWAEALRRTQTLTTLRGDYAAHRETLATYARARLAGAKASNTKNK